MDGYFPVSAKIAHDTPASLEIEAGFTLQAPVFLFQLESGGGDD